MEDLFPSKAGKPVISLNEPTHQYRMWKQHPDVLPILPAQSENDIDRQEIIYEFIATETSFNRDLDLIIRVSDFSFFLLLFFSCLFVWYAALHYPLQGAGRDPEVHPNRL